MRSAPETAIGTRSVDLYSFLADRPEPRPEPNPTRPRPGSTTTAKIETTDHDYTGALLHAISP